MARFEMQWHQQSYHHSVSTIMYQQVCIIPAGCNEASLVVTPGLPFFDIKKSTDGKHNGWIGMHYPSKLQYNTPNNNNELKKRAITLLYPY